jgi:hypothetical protein
MIVCQVCQSEITEGYYCSDPEGYWCENHKPKDWDKWYIEANTHGDFECYWSTFDEE